MGLRLALRLGTTLCVAVPAFAAVGCSAGTTYVDTPSPPVAIDYAIDFQNQRNAIGSKFIKVRVFDATVAGADIGKRATLCADLVDRAKTRQDPPENAPVLVETADISPCEVIAPAPAARPGPGTLSVSFGVRAVVVVARNPASTPTPERGDEILVGCGIGEVRPEGSDPITVPLREFTSFRAAPPPGACVRLVDRCNASPGCPDP